MSAPVRPDPWLALARHTPARIALGRAGTGLPTREVLAFALGHARARDAVHAPFDPVALAADLAGVGPTLCVSSAAADRPTYLRRPDLGRQLDEAGRARLADQRQGHDLAIVVADGLSGAAIQRHAVPVTRELARWMRAAGLSLAPVVVATQARVALGDEIGALLGARLVVVLIGERPGLTAPDSLGAYLTFAPRPGRTDAERNCVSNIRPEGLEPVEAAGRIAWLAREALRLSLTGVGLKDESGLDRLVSGAAPPLAPPGA